MKVVLELKQQSSNIQRVTVRHDIVIGRGSDCNLRISAPQVSRRHCFLRVDGEGVAVTDLESCNGTWIDGQRTVPGKRYPLTNGMKLAVGPVLFVARISDGSDADEPVNQDVEAAASQAPAAVPQDPVPAPEVSPIPVEASEDLTADYTGDVDDLDFIDSQELQIVGGQSAEVVILSDPLQAVDGNVSVEAMQLVSPSEILEIDDDDDLVVADEIVAQDDTNA